MGASASLQGRGRGRGEAYKADDLQKITDVEKKEDDLVQSQQVPKDESGFSNVLFSCIREVVAELNLIGVGSDGTDNQTDGILDYMRASRSLMRGCKALVSKVHPEFSEKLKYCLVLTDDSLRGSYGVIQTIEDFEENYQASLWKEYCADYYTVIYSDFTENESYGGLISTYVEKTMGLKTKIVEEEAVALPVYTSGTGMVGAVLIVFQSERSQKQKLGLTWGETEESEIPYETISRYINEIGNLCLRTIYEDIQRTLLQHETRKAVVNYEIGKMNKVDDKSILKSLDRFCEYISKVLDAASVRIFTLNDSGNELWTKYPNDEIETRIKVGTDTIIGLTLLEEMSFTLSDASNNEGVKFDAELHNKINDGKIVHSMLAACIRDDVDRLGVVVAMNKGDIFSSDCFSKLDMELLEATTGHIASIIRDKFLQLHLLMASAPGSNQDDHLRSLLSLYDDPNSDQRGSSRKAKSSVGLNDAILLKGNNRMTNVEAMNAINDWCLDPYEVDHMDLVQYALYIFDFLQIPLRFQVDKVILQNFLVEVKDGYLPNPYHNWEHGFSVFHCVYLLLTKTDALQYLKYMDIYGLLLAAICHDIGHPGTNNNYQVQAGTSLAIVYNDRSVLENFHASKTFTIMREQENNVLQSFSPDKAKNVREIIIKAILATDIASHFKLIGVLKDRLHVSSNTGISIHRPSLDRMPELASYEKKLAFNEKSKVRNSDFLERDKNPQIHPKKQRATISNVNANRKGRRSSFFVERLSSSRYCPLSRDIKEDRELLVEALIHTSDLNNPILNFDITLKWSKRVAQEFYDQSKQEEKLGIPSQPFMKNEPGDMVKLAKLQTDFIDFVAGPLWQVMSEYFPELRDRVKKVEDNRQEWMNILKGHKPGEGSNTGLTEEDETKEET